MRATTCCFSGHRKLPEEKIEQIVKRLGREIDSLISLGVTNFISGGALGFDLIAASLIIAKKEMGRKIRLIFILPCKDQDKFWNDENKRLYRALLAEADEIVHISEEYTDGCMKKRNNYMVEQSAYCICALIRPQSGTGQMVRYARQMKLKIINVAD
jgi:uncharacterized phage-like protein YoqJ